MPKEMLLELMTKHPDIEMDVSLTLLQTISIIGNIELALRHPKNKGHSSNIAKQAAEYLIKEMFLTWPEMYESKELVKAWSTIFDFKLE
ncbi:hypothetical protein LCGC14_2761320 [marine sediment metagenome]|uniref:Uncharacterized protein n=1 Tax=marine sediment metagenome TaxID=412755 RepID=A0A0F9BQG9_9ZZZZ